MDDGNVIKFRGVEEQRRSHWVEWLWRAAGGTIISVLALLMITMFNQQNTTINNLQFSTNELKEKAGAAKSGIESLQGLYESSMTLSRKFNDNHKVVDDATKKELDDLKERLIRLEEQHKAFEARLKALEDRTKTVEEKAEKK